MTNGLSGSEARQRLTELGPNEIRRERTTPRLVIFGRQFGNPLVALLAIAVAVSLATREWLDAMAIAAIVLLNAAIGYFQEHRAERAVTALRAMTAPRARVRRDGVTIVVPAAEVVEGDCLVLETGDITAADARLLRADRLSANEAALTGESTPVEKNTITTSAGTPLADRHDFVFMGTSIATGTGIAEVVGTGMRTELGRIAELLATAERQVTPLQRHLAGVSRMLIYLCAAIVALVAITAILQGWPAMQVFLASISLAVAAVPEGLPTIVTIALALGVQRMAVRHVLVRRLPAVETLGCATVICTDKTGTLTTGIMSVRELWGSDHAELLYAAAAASDAELLSDGRRGAGDPTELAILEAAAERGIYRSAIEHTAPRRHVMPFDPLTRRMSIIREDGTEYMKGAFEVILPMVPGTHQDATDAHRDMAGRGLRVLAVATVTAGVPRLHGLIGIADPPRTEAIEAVTAARHAGITTVMITGDHARTARAIAAELGIVTNPAEVHDRVHARATPEDKLAIIRGWKERGAVVAMTGDGANDAPALKEADIGIAMGIAGTEVAREAADMVLADDNFASIVAAIREGRGIFDNIRKTLVYLLTGNTAELMVMFVAAAAGLPLPLLPLQLLWINVVTDGLPALALVVDPPEQDVMHRPPRPPDEPILGRAQWRFIVTAAALEAAVTLGVFLWALDTRGLPAARNLTFSVLVFAEVFRAFAARSSMRIIWEVGLLTNVWLLAVVVLSVAVQFAIHHLSAARAVFETAPLSLTEGLLILLAALCPVTMIELGKLGRRSGAVRERMV